MVILIVYQRNRVDISDDMKPILEHGFQEKYIDMIFSGRSKYFTVKHTHGADSFSKEKELYYLEALCTKEMMGMSFDFYYKWYSAAISFTDYLCSEISTKEILDSYQSVFSAGIEFAGPHLEELFTQMMRLLFSDFDESRNPDKVLDFYGLSKKYGFAMNIYEDMVDKGFSTPELNPETFILGLWDSYHSPGLSHPRAVFDISCETGLPARKIMDFLMTHGKIDSQLIFDSWDSGSDPKSIAFEFELETKDVQAYLKENLHLLKRKEDLWQLDYDYDDCDDDW